MDVFFASIYDWFCDSSMTVYKIMDTISNDNGDTLLSSSFPTMGITTFIISFIIAFAFYIWPINHPRFKAWWAWLIMLATNAIINLGLAFAFINHRLSEIHKSEDAISNFTDEETLFIPFAQWLDLARSNVFVSIIFFIIVSLMLNWFSTTCRYSPFRK